MPKPQSFQILIVGEEIKQHLQYEIADDEVTFIPCVYDIIAQVDPIRALCEKISLSDFEEILASYRSGVYRWIEKYTSLYNLDSLIYLKVNQVVWFLRKNKITHVFFPSAVPHHFDTIILAIACQLNQITQLFLYPDPLLGRYFCVEQKGCLSNRKIIRLFEKNGDDFEFDFLKKFMPPTWSSQLRKYKSWFYPTLIYVFIRRSISLAVRTVRGKSIVDELEKTLGVSGPRITPLLQSHLKQEKFLRKYHKNCTSFEYGKLDGLTFLVYSNMQPEATSAPEGGQYRSMLDVIFSIRSDFSEASIYYKEHPANVMFIEDYILETRVGYCRDVDYLSALLKLDCKLLPLYLEREVISDINQKCIVVTLNGTIAIQRSLNGLRTVVFGHMLLKDIPGVCTWDEFCSLDPKSQSIFTKFSKKTAEDATKYLQNLYATSTFSAEVNIGRGGQTTEAINDRSDWVERVVKKIKTME